MTQKTASVILVMTMFEGQSITTMDKWRRVRIPVRFLRIFEEKGGRHVFVTSIDDESVPPLALIAPSIYWTALSVFLSADGDNDMSVEAIGKALTESFHNLSYEEALLSSIGLRNEDTYQ